ncbi:hypothetical protein AVEN_159690-1 [Araneus ventricosus]|uniref:Uncharacterized protein n=1 Tax=Araneus ventricosus TaxID=182803 RepID=A0A4Y1ZLS0_ARAVE|nr:hypothetical protein AVEN_159690-1 [Araneus ventricosus]
MPSHHSYEDTGCPTKDFPILKLNNSATEIDRRLRRLETGANLGLRDKNHQRSRNSHTCRRVALYVCDMLGPRRSMAIAFRKQSLQPHHIESKYVHFFVHVRRFTAFLDSGSLVHIAAYP